jgi:hypothetical protein
MMGSVSLETCLASHKYENIKILIHFCILLDFSLRMLFVSLGVGIYVLNVCTN